MARIDSNTTVALKSVDKSIREDLSDDISRLAAGKTPVLEKIGMKKVESRQHDWTQDTLATPNPDNAAKAASQAEYNEIVGVTKRTNPLQIFQKAVTTDAAYKETDTAGGKGKQSYEIIKKGVENQRDIEAMLISLNNGVIPTNLVAGKSASFAAMIETNTTFGIGGSAGGWNDATGVFDSPTAGDVRVITEKMVVDVLEKMWVSCEEKKTYHAYMPASLKKKFAEFTGSAANTSIIDKGVRSLTIDIYDCDNGKLHVVGHPLMTGKDYMIIIDPDNCSFMAFRIQQKEELAKTGDSNQVQLITEGGFMGER